MNISIITSENRRLYPALVYNTEDNELKKPITEIDDIYDLLYKKQNILVLSTQYDQYGNEIKFFNGQLEKSDIKALYSVNEDMSSKGLAFVMTLSEAAKKWGLSDGSTIRKAIERGKFQTNEVKQAGDVWITTYSAMERVFGSIRNEENAYVIYDDFETVYLTTKINFAYAQLAYLRGLQYDMKLKEIEEKYKYVKDVFINALNAIKDGGKVLIKKSRNNKIRQIINTTNELLFYIDTFRSKRNLPPELINRLIDDLKSVEQ